MRPANFKKNSAKSVTVTLKPKQTGKVDKQSATVRPTHTSRVWRQCCPNTLLLSVTSSTLTRRAWNVWRLKGSLIRICTCATAHVNRKTREEVISTGHRIPGQYLQLWSVKDWPSTHPLPEGDARLSVNITRQEEHKYSVVGSWRHRHVTGLGFRGRPSRTHHCTQF